MTRRKLCKLRRAKRRAGGAGSTRKGEEPRPEAANTPGMTAAQMVVAVKAAGITETASQIRGLNDDLTRVGGFR